MPRGGYHKPGKGKKTGRPTNAERGLPNRVDCKIYISQDAYDFFRDYAARHGLKGWGYAAEIAAQLLEDSENSSKLCEAMKEKELGI